jgi:hypothetical protein
MGVQADTQSKVLLTCGSVLMKERAQRVMVSDKRGCCLLVIEVLGKLIEFTHAGLAF